MDGDILLVDDNPGMIQVMGRILVGLGQLRFATSGPAAPQQARDRPPDVVLLDAEMPGMSGFEVCEQMRADPALCDIPIIFVTAHDGQDEELRGLQVGAVDFIAKPVSEPLLLARVRTQLRIKRLTDELRRIATTDALTGVCNRRAFDDALGCESRRSLRSRTPLSLLLIDIDHFKLFNDRYGHPAGDASLRAVAHALRAACWRPGDTVARYGGEEFAVLLPEVARRGAAHLAERLLGAIDTVAISHDSSPTAARLTVSIGIACCELGGDLDTVAGLRDNLGARLTDAADRALYDAKRAGRAQAWLTLLGAAENTPSGKVASHARSPGLRAP